MRILVFGASGMLGHKVIQVLSEQAEVWGTLRGDAPGFRSFGILPNERMIGGIDASSEVSIREIAIWRCTMYFMLLMAISYESFYGLLIPFLFKVGITAIVGILIVGLFARAMGHRRVPDPV